MVYLPGISFPVFFISTVLLFVGRASLPHILVPVLGWAEHGPGLSQSELLISPSPDPAGTNGRGCVDRNAGTKVKGRYYSLLKLNLRDVRS